MKHRFSPPTCCGCTPATATPGGGRVETLDSSPSEVGGFKSVTLKVSGDEVFRFLRYESGVHRVQRVPTTETQGRIHTSTATVAVLPEAEEVDVEIQPEDIEIQASRAGGPGGQGVNTTDSAVQVVPQPDRSGHPLHRNPLADQEPRAGDGHPARQPFEAKQREEQEKYAAHRRSLIGSGGREEKIRTYNYPQNRVTDHRIGLTVYNLDLFVEGQIDDMVMALQRRDMEERMAALQAECRALKVLPERSFSVRDRTATAIMSANVRHPPAPCSATSAKTRKQTSSSPRSSTVRCRR